MGDRPGFSLLVPTVWRADADRFERSLRASAPPGSSEVVPVGEGPFAAAHNAALVKAGGDLVAIVDTSVELTDDLFSALAAALADESVAVAGPFGLVTADLCDYEERTSGDVAAVQGYCLAARRVDLLAAGGYREGFAFYRNADIDLSLRLRTLDGAVRRAVAEGAERCVRHAHRAWEATPEDERMRLSRLNMGQVHDLFPPGRSDLLVP